MRPQSLAIAIMVATSIAADELTPFPSGTVDSSQHANADPPCPSAEDTTAPRRRRTPPIDHSRARRTTRRARVDRVVMSSSAMEKNERALSALRHDVDTARQLPLHVCGRRTIERQLEHERTAVVGDASHHVEPPRRARRPHGCLRREEQRHVPTGSSPRRRSALCNAGSTSARKVALA